jgi:hypothetical protein
VTQCHLIDCYENFGEICCLLLLSWKMEVAGSSKMLQPVYQSTWYHTPKDCKHNHHYHGNIKTHISYFRHLTNCNKFNSTWWEVPKKSNAILDVHRTVHHNIYFYSKSNQMHQLFKFILFWNNTQHASKQMHYLFDIYLLMYVQSWTPDDGWKDHLKHIECYSKIK